MRKVIGFSLFVVATLTILVWGVSYFIQPILPAQINNNMLLFFAVLLSVLAGLAAFKDTIELIRTLGDHISADSKESILHNLPQPENSLFIGRQAEIKQITQLLSPLSRHFVITIDGIGGVGKSALALEVANSYLKSYKKLPRNERFQAIIWTTAKQYVLTGDGISPRYQVVQVLEDIYTTIATVLKAPETLKVVNNQRYDLVRHILTLQRTLLIIDNLETVDDERVLDFIRNIPNPVKVIVTTRHRIDVAYPIRLLGMTERESIQLILNEAKIRDVKLSESDAQKLFRASGGIPLAIALSIAQVGFGHRLETVLDRLKEPGGDLAKFCFNEALKIIEGKSAYKILMALSIVNEAATRETLGYITNCDENDRDEGLRLLEKLSLVNKNNEMFSLLPLTQSFAYSELQKNQELEYQFQLAASDYLGLPSRKKIKPSLQESFGQLLRHYRLTALDHQTQKPLTQEKLSRLLGGEIGITFSGAAISDWERDYSHIHKDDRLVLVSIIKVLYKNKGIKNLSEANALLEAGNYRALNKAEIEQLSITS